ncbi:MAG: hypothetical protein WC812_03200 [Candidatus Pacearchaeota archaeon]|jgi:hypothetical protein
MELIDKILLNLDKDLNEICEMFEDEIANYEFVLTRRYNSGDLSTPWALIYENGKLKEYTLKNRNKIVKEFINSKF